MTRDMFDKFHERDDRGRFGDNDAAPRGGRVTGSSKLADIKVALHHKTDRAYLVSIDGREDHAVWIAKSVAEIEIGNAVTMGSDRRGQVVQLPLVTITLQEWVAKEKGLI